MYTLYILSDHKKTKVGITARPLDRRLKEYNTHNPHWKLIDHFKIGTREDAKRVEGAIKAFLKPFKSVAGGDEWFDVPATQVVDLTKRLVGALHRICSSPRKIFHPIAIPHEIEAALNELHSMLEEGIPPHAPQKKREERRQKIIELRKNIRREFSRSFGLGIPYDELDETGLPIAGKEFGGPDFAKVSNPDPIKVKHASYGYFRDFDPPNKDHFDFFFELAPLSTGAYYAFCSAWVLMPYCPNPIDNHWDATNPEWKRVLEETKSYADKMGWDCVDHSEWSWHYPGATGLMLLSPKTPVQEKIAKFEKSFRKFVLENERKYSLVPMPRLEEVVTRIAFNQCFPLDVQSFEDLNYKLDIEDEDDRELINAYNFLFSEWHKDH